jgi:hypothetical protein
VHKLFEALAAGRKKPISSFGRSKCHTKKSQPVIN